MSVFFGFHVVDLAVYRDVLASVARATSGDAASKDEIVARTRKGIDACARMPWNREDAADWLVDLYGRMVDEFDADPRDQEVEEEFGGVAIAVLALPLFQAWPGPTMAAQSPNFASLCYSDAGFYALLSRDRRVSKIMATRNPLEKYPLGDSTTLLSSQEVSDLRAAAAATAIPPSDEHTEAVQRTARDHLVRVCAAGLSSADAGVLYTIYA